MSYEPQRVVECLRELQRGIRDAVIASRDNGDLASVTREAESDTIYGIDAAVEPVIEAFCEEWGRETPLVVVAEGIEPETGAAFPRGTKPEDAELRILMDPIDGTRGIMYDKRPAWALACAAPNRGPDTRLSDAFAAVMTELPTSRMGYGDVLWAIRGQGAKGQRQNLTLPHFTKPLKIQPSTSPTLAHGFASVANFFPATKVLASQLMEHLVEHTLGRVDATKAQVFDDQYISTGGQFYELIVGHDRFIADLRPMFYAMQRQPPGLCCHPYDCAGLLIAEEAGVILTDGLGDKLDAPMDTTTPVSWAGFANRALHDLLQPLVRGFIANRGVGGLA